MDDVELDDEDLELLLTLETTNGNPGERSKDANAKAGGVGEAVVPKTEPRASRDKRAAGPPSTSRPPAPPPRGRGFEGVSQHNKSRRPTQGHQVVERGTHHAETLSRIRVAKPLMGSLVLRERASLFPYYKLGDLDRTSKDAFAGAWSTLGVIVEKSFPKEGSNGGKYLVVKLGDLEDATFSLFLFGDAFAVHSLKLEYGSLLLVQCAKCKVDEKTRSLSLSVTQGDQITKVGAARDFAVCKGTRRDGQKCTMWVNARHSEFCKYHASQALKKLKNAQMQARPMLGGSQLYAHQQKELLKHERARDEMIQRQRGAKSVKNLSSSQLVKFTDKYADSVGDYSGRGLGAIRAVAKGPLRLENRINPFSGPTSKANPRGERMVNLGAQRHGGLGAGGSASGGAGGGGRSGGKRRSDEISYSKALAFVKSIGGLPAPDPNTTTKITFCPKTTKAGTAAASSGAAGKRKRVMGGGGKENRQGQPGGQGRQEDRGGRDQGPDFLVERQKKRAAQQNKFLASFSQAREQSKGKRRVESLYRSEAEDQDFAERSQRLKPLIQKEGLTEQLVATHKVKTKEGVKRFWECAACGYRVTTINAKYPKGKCPKPNCGSDVFNKAGMVRAPKVRQARDEMRVRGKEQQKFLRSVR